MQSTIMSFYVNQTRKYVGENVPCRGAGVSFTTALAILSDSSGRRRGRSRGRCGGGVSSGGGRGGGGGLSYKTICRTRNVRKT